MLICVTTHSIRLNSVQTYKYPHLRSFISRKSLGLEKGRKEIEMTSLEAVPWNALQDAMVNECFGSRWSIALLYGFELQFF